MVILSLDMLLFVILIIVSILLTILLFNFFFKKKNKYNYKFKVKNTLTNSQFDFHHNLIFTKKKNKSISEKDIKVYYPLYGDMKISKLSTNNYGYFNGKNGNKEVVTQKKKNCFRINCLGDSAIANYISNQKDELTSIPAKLEEKINQNLTLNKTFEVNNFAQGMYGIQEIIYKLIFENIYTKPDAIVLYLGYNDIEAYLVDEFKEDYSNYKKNLNQSRNIIKFSNYIYDFKLNFVNYLFNRFFLYNIRTSIKKFITKGKVNLNSDYSKGLLSFKKNLEIFSSTCKSQDIKLIICTYCHYLYDEIKFDKKFNKFDEIIKKQNIIIRELCSKNSIYFVDMEKEIPNIRKNYLDNIHFSNQGMEIFSSKLVSKLKEVIK